MSKYIVKLHATFIEIDVLRVFITMSLELDSGFSLVLCKLNNFLIQTSHDKPGNEFLSKTRKIFKF
jgi:hypothetical protein